MPVQLTRDQFPLPKLAPKLVAIGKEVNAGRGFKVVRYFAYMHSSDITTPTPSPHAIGSVGSYNVHFVAYLVHDCLSPLALALAVHPCSRLEAWQASGCIY